MSNEEQKIKHSARLHKSFARKLYEKKNDITHSHHTDNPRRVVKEETIQEKRFKQRM